jgi:hypothetical protein
LREELYQPDPSACRPQDGLLALAAHKAPAPIVNRNIERIDPGPATKLRRIPDARSGPEIAHQNSWDVAICGSERPQGSSRFERRSNQRMIEQQHDPLKVCR